MNAIIINNPVVQQCKKEIENALTVMHLRDIRRTHFPLFDNGVLNREHGEYLFEIFNKKQTSLIEIEKN